MNWDQIQGKWMQFKGRAKSRWGRLTDDDLTVIDGQRDRLVGRLQELYGLEKEEAQSELKEFCDDCERELANTMR